MSSVGSVISNLISIGAGLYLNIQPPVGEEWVIHNINHEDAVELCFYDGTNNLLIDSDTEKGAWAGFFFHCTNSRYYRVKNTATAAKLISYDGIITKV